MKRSLILSLTFGGLFLLAATTSLLAADAKKVTLTGEGKCAKCAMKETDSCQNAIQVTENGKKVTYYLEGDKSKEFHSNICKAPKEVKATGTVKTVDGKKIMTVESIQLVEK